MSFVISRCFLFIHRFTLFFRWLPAYLCPIIIKTNIMNTNHHSHHTEQFLHENKNRHRQNPGAILVIATLLIGIGIILLLNAFGIFSDQVVRIIISWPMLLIAIGALGFIKENHNFGNLILIAVGLFFLVPRIWDIPDYTSTFWPLILILLGILMLTRFGEVKRRLDKIPVSKNQGSEDLIEDTNIFGGGQRIYTTQNFRGGKITSIFGGSEIDFTKAKMAPGTNILDVTYIFGGSTIIVPNHWELRIETTSIMGSISDKRMVAHLPEERADSILIIKGIAIFGGGEIKSY
ncbi:MAG: hypothetical protein EOL88_10365 [Bacteroidia bacterium]|nr:hypothetical protein [Bacteroidia bacterium]